MKIAIVKLSALGDIIHTMIVLQFIKKYRPDCIIDWIVEKKFKSILDNNPDINKIHSINLSKVKKRKSPILLLKELKKIRQFGKYDLVIDAQGLLKSAIVARFLGAKKIYGFDKNSIREPIASFFYHNKISIKYNKNTIDRNVAVICEHLDIKISSNDIINKSPFLFFNDSFTIYEKDYIVFIVNSNWENRNYPLEKFVEIANNIKLKCFVAWSNKNEQNKALWMSKESNYIEILPKLDLNKLKSIINSARLLIGNDTGPTHIAWGLNIPSITIFGPTPENRVYKTPINKTIKSNSIINHRKLNKKDDSIKNIAVSDIVTMAKKLLNK